MTRRSVPAARADGDVPAVLGDELGEISAFEAHDRFSFAGPVLSLEFVPLARIPRRPTEYRDHLR